jgi:ElaB/YqjD/DUF883 family membrane-anchored ribosome-binding protein
MATIGDDAKDTIDEAAGVADQAIQQVAHKASEVTERARVVAKDVIDEGRDVLETALTCSKDAIRANPITSVAVVAAIAYLWGRLRS